MISTAALSMIYAFMAMGSSSILYFSFREKVDISARFFVTAELMIIPAMISTIITILIPSSIQPALLFINNLATLAADISIIFSLYALSHEIQLKKYFLAIFTAVIYCAIIELCRVFDPKIPLLLISLGMAVLAFGAFLTCNTSLNTHLKNNQFLAWLKNLEIAHVLFSLLRAASYFTTEFLVPRNPTVSVTVLYAIFISLSIFRYIAYQSLRVSWIDPRANNGNRLNINLATVAKEKEQLIQNLMLSNRALGISALASALAHQLSQPLTSISLQTATIKRDLTEANAHKNSVVSLNKISLQLENLADLVKNLRQLFGSRDQQFSEITLLEVTDALLEIIVPTLESKKIHLEKNYLSNPVILGNAIQIQQVLINLFNNAIDAFTSNHSGPKNIELSISQNQRFAIICIKDNGAGIDTEFLPTIFDLYKTSKPNGLGIGLWLCKTIIDMQGGIILASNNTEGGALFEIQIPLA